MAEENIAAITKNQLLVKLKHFISAFVQVDHTDREMPVLDGQRGRDDGQRRTHGRHASAVARGKRCQESIGHQEERSHDEQERCGLGRRRGPADAS